MSIVTTPDGHKRKGQWGICQRLSAINVRIWIHGRKTLAMGYRRGIWKSKAKSIFFFRNYGLFPNTQAGRLSVLYTYIWFWYIVDFSNGYFNPM